MPNPFSLVDYTIRGPDAIKYVIAGTPFATTTLLQYRGTRSIRIILWALGLVCAAWGLATCGGESQAYRLPGFLFVALTVWRVQLNSPEMDLNMYASTKWAFARSPAKQHPLPRQPPFGFLRQLRLVQGLLLPLNSFREIGIAPNPPLVALPGRWRWPKAMAYHLAMTLANIVGMDFATYPARIFGPDDFGKPNVGGDFAVWYTAQARVLGVPPTLVWLFWAFLHAFGTFFGMSAAYHLYAFTGIGVGLYLPEEWPKLFHQPWLSTSVAELWGTRWHTYLKNQFLFFAQPFARFGRSAEIFGCFAVSGVFHILIYYTVSHELAWWPFMSYYCGNGLGVIIERSYFKSTGRKVQGNLGRLWCWTWLILVSYPMCSYQYSKGQTTINRAQFSDTMRPYSLAEWTGYYMGWGTRPTEPIPGILSGWENRGW